MWIEDPDGIRIVLVEVPPINRCAATYDPGHHHDQDVGGRSTKLSVRDASGLV